jgi:hypothetical protein
MFNKGIDFFLTSSSYSHPLFYKLLCWPRVLSKVFYLKNVLRCTSSAKTDSTKAPRALLFLTLHLWHLFMQLSIYLTKSNYKLSLTVVTDWFYVYPMHLCLAECLAHVCIMNALVNEWMNEQMNHDHKLFSTLSHCIDFLAKNSYSYSEKIDVPALVHRPLIPVLTSERYTVCLSTYSSLFSIYWTPPVCQALFLPLGI